MLVRFNNDMTNYKHYTFHHWLFIMAIIDNLRGVGLPRNLTHYPIQYINKAVNYNNRQ